MAYTKKILNSFGCQSWKVHAWMIYLFYTILLLASETTFIYNIRKDTYLFLTAIMYYSLPILGIYKISIVLYFRQKIAKMHSTIKKNFLDLCNVRPEISEKVNLRSLINDRVFRGICWGAFIVALVIVIRPQAKFPKGNRFMPPIVWQSFEENSSLFEIFYKACTPILWIFITVMAVITHDYNFFYLVHNLSVQLIILKELLRNVSEVSGINIDDMYDSDLYQEIINKRLKDCIGHQLLLNKFFKDLRGTFSFSLFLQFLISIELMVFASFLFQMNSKGTLSTMNSLGFVGLLCLQTAYIAWYGSDLEYQSETLACAAYCSKWYFGKKIRKALLILLINSQTPMKLTAGSLIYVNNQLMITVYKTVFSLVTLIERMSTLKGSA